MSKSCSNKEKTKKPKSKARKIISWCVTIFFGLFLALAIGVQIIGLTTKGDNFGVPNYFGNQVLVVLTDSMEPDLPVGSAVIVRKVKMEEYQIGDDITFMDPSAKVPITHRLSDIKTPEESGDGLYHFETHGINTHSNQCQGVAGDYADCTGQLQHFTEKDVIGKVVGCSLFLGGFFNFLTSVWGLLIILLIPTLYLIISSVIDIVKAVNDPVDHDKDNPPSGGGNDDKSNPELEHLNGLSKEEKERLKQELLDEMLAKGKGNS